jgi:hypothetical protein
MIALLPALMLFSQGTPLLSENGTISVVLKTSSGQPAVGVRVAAMAIPESKLDAITGAEMASLVTTDEAGRYRLENIPPGRYYITAGRVDFPTYFPGALDMAYGTPTSRGDQKLPGLYGRVVEEADSTPIPHGSVTILGRTRTTISIDPDGKFAIPHLLPGSYDLRVEVFEHFTRYETIVIDDQDIHVDLAVRSNLSTPEERATSQLEPPH